MTPRRLYILSAVRSEIERRKMIAHLLFEQSGTFKNAFKKNGIEAFDYDIQNEFEQMDFQIDIFGEIQKAFEGGGKVCSIHSIKRTL